MLNATICRVNGYCGGLAVYLLALAIVCAPAAATDMNALKDRAAGGDDAARVELVQELLMSLPPIIEVDAPSPALFSAQCWWEGFDRFAAVDAGTVSDRTVAEIDRAFSRFENDLRLVPSDQMRFGDVDQKRWGDGATDRFNLRNRNIRESLPATAEIFNQLARNRNFEEAVNRAEALDWSRPETHALIAQLHVMSGKLPEAEAAARRTLQIYRGHYSGHSVLAQIEFRRLKGRHTCDTALAWAHMLQADIHNGESALVLTNLIELYQYEPDAGRLKTLRDRLDARIRYHELAKKHAAQSSGGRSPYQPYLSDTQLEQFRKLRDQADQELAKLR